MKRKLFTILSAVSLGMSVVTATLCVGSQFKCYAIGFSNLRKYWVETKTDALAFVVFTDYSSGAPMATSNKGKLFAEPAPPTSFIATSQLLGFGYDVDWVFYTGSQPFSSARRAIAIPWWFIGGLTLSLPIVWAMRRRHAARMACVGQVTCSRCGYDLRATPQRCPECGNVPKATA
jgi:hypothetical protein